MAVAVTAANSASAASGTIVSVSLTIPAGSNLALYGFAATTAVWTSRPIVNSVDWNTSESLTLLQRYAVHTLELTLWELTAPTTGALTARFHHDDGEDTYVCGVISCSGVDQTTPSDTPITETFSFAHPTDDITSATDDLTIFMAGMLGDNSAGTSTDQTEQIDLHLDGAGVGDCWLGVCTAAGTASNTHTRTMANTHNGGSIGVNVNAAAAAATENIHTRFPTVAANPW